MVQRWPVVLNVEWHNHSTLSTTGHHGGPLFLAILKCLGELKSLRYIEIHCNLLSQKETGVKEPNGSMQFSF